MTAALRHAWDARVGQGIAPRYHDRQLRCDVIKVMPGEYEVTDGEDALVTLLGSCVAACVRDPALGLGGMNHFMLPDDERGGGTANARYGAYAMEVLINELIKRGAQRRRLEAKVFGGGNVMRGFTQNRVGDRNAQFVLEYLDREQIPIVAQDLGDAYARKVAFWVRTGRVLVRHLPMAATAADLAAEQAYERELRQQPVDGGVELFD